MLPARLNLHSTTSQQRNVRVFHRVSDASPSYSGSRPAASIFPTQPVAAGLPQRNFSAALLELGLHHHVEGLVRRAGEALHFEAMVRGQDARLAAEHYRQADAAFSNEAVPCRFATFV